MIRNEATDLLSLPVPTQGPEGLRIPLQAEQWFEQNIRFQAGEIGQFAKLAGDLNPLHHDEDYAARSRFGCLIASGAQTSSFLSAAVATQLSCLQPSLGLETRFRFHQAVLAEHPYKGVWTISSIRHRVGRSDAIVVIEARLLDATDKPVVSGTVTSIVTIQEASPLM